MAKLYPYKEAWAGDGAEKDYAGVTMYGKSGVGSQYYFFKKGLKTFYLPLDKIRSAHRSIEIVNANACTAGENLFIQRLYVTTCEDEDIITIIPDKKQAEKVFALLKERGVPATAIEKRGK